MTSQEKLVVPLLCQGLIGRVDPEASKFESNLDCTMYGIFSQSFFSYSILATYYYTEAC